MLLAVLLGISCWAALGGCLKQEFSSPRTVLQLYSSLQDRLGAHYSGQSKTSCFLDSIVLID